MHNLGEQKMRQIHLDRDCNFREFDISAQKNIKIGEKTHVPRERSSRILKNGGRSGRDLKIFKPGRSHFTFIEVGDMAIFGTILAQQGDVQSRSQIFVGENSTVCSHAKTGSS
jgi:hypothetical protein